MRRVDAIVVDTQRASEVDFISQLGSRSLLRLVGVLMEEKKRRPDLRDWCGREWHTYPSRCGVVEGEW